MVSSSVPISRFSKCGGQRKPHRPNLRRPECPTSRVLWRGFQPDKALASECTGPTPLSPSPLSPHFPATAPSYRQHSPRLTTLPNSHTHKSSAHDSASARPYPPSDHN